MFGSKAPRKEREREVFYFRRTNVKWPEHKVKYTSVGQRIYISQSFSYSMKRWLFHRRWVILNRIFWLRRNPDFSVLTHSLSEMLFWRQREKFSLFSSERKEDSMWRLIFSHLLQVKTDHIIGPLCSLFWIFEAHVRKRDNSKTFKADGYTVQVREKERKKTPTQQHTSRVSSSELSCCLSDTVAPASLYSSRHSLSLYLRLYETIELEKHNLNRARCLYSRESKVFADVKQQIKITTQQCMMSTVEFSLSVSNGVVSVRVRYFHWAISFLFFSHSRLAVRASCGECAVCVSTHKQNYICIAPVQSVHIK